jgi:hypothetical protein
LIETVDRVLASDLLAPELVTVPDRGAADDELTNVFDLERADHLPLIQLLRRWNGLDLDTVRIHGVGNLPDGICSAHRTGDGLVFASDPAGFVYVLKEDGSVSSVDHDGGSVTRVADDVVDFICNFVFGNRAVDFAGDDWAADVATALGNT